MLDRIYISEIQTDLEYNDRRSVLRWCRNMGVKIFTDKGCRIQYAIKDEYEMIKNYQIIEYLKQKYGTDNFSNMFMKIMESLDPKTDSKNKSKSQYIPQYENEKRMLSIFTKL